MKMKKKPRKLTAVGITCGIGSMLIGARQARFNVVGNIEWRGYYHTGTFEQNFQNAFMVKNLDKLTDRQRVLINGIDLVMGHPECGNFSHLRCDKTGALDDPADIPLFVQMVRDIRPKFFVMDDLPKSLIAYSMEDYAKELGDYDLFPEWVSNYHYGNPQKGRKRMFMIGSLKGNQWAFSPGERDVETTVKDVIQDLLGAEDDVPQHLRHVMDTQCKRANNLLKRGSIHTWKQVREWFQSKKTGTHMSYVKENGEVGYRMSSYKAHWNGPCHVLTGGDPLFHPIRNDPLTVRERARLQGFPDNFEFKGMKIENDGAWNHEKNIWFIKQTGKAMPVQFCRYVARQIAAHIQDKPFEASGVRLANPNEYLNDAKVWYCQNVGYSNQGRACAACWLRGASCPKESATVPVKRIEKGFKVTAATKRTKKQTKGAKGKRKKLATRQPVTQIVATSYTSKASPLVRVPLVHVVKKRIPEAYGCDCRYCQEPIGELKRRNGGYYSRLERREYYADAMERARVHEDAGHIAKTPLHVARWAVQQYTGKKDWVLDPTAGAGTTMVEALVQGRNAVGVDIQYEGVIRTNVKRHARGGRTGIVGIGDARAIGPFLSQIQKRFQLIVNNPPYPGDMSQKGMGAPRYEYDKNRANIALLPDGGTEYWRTMQSVYTSCLQYLKKGGRFVVGIKDQMRQKKPDQLHEKFADLLKNLGLQHEGTAFLRHHPATLFLNTYFKRWGVHPPYYQTILVFRK